MERVFKRTSVTTRLVKGLVVVAQLSRFVSAGLHKNLVYQRKF